MGVRTGLDTNLDVSITLIVQLRVAQEIYAQRDSYGLCCLRSDPE